MGKMGGDLGGFLRNAQKQAREMQRKMEQIETRLAERIVEGSAGGGMVKALVNGRQEIVAVKIAPEVVDPADVEMLEDLIVAACSQGLKKSREVREEEMKRLAGGLRIPGLF